jgi:hypothetical protein
MPCSCIENVRCYGAESPATVFVNYLSETLALRLLVRGAVKCLTPGNTAPPLDKTHQLPGFVGFRCCSAVRVSPRCRIF